MYELGKSDAKISVAVGLSRWSSPSAALRDVLRRQQHRRQLPARPTPAIPRRPQGCRRMTDPPAAPPSGSPTCTASTAGCTALDGLTLHIAPGEFVALLGPVRLRQDHRAALPRRAGGPRLGHRRRRRPGPHPGADQQARHGHGVPGLQPVPAHDRPRRTSSSGSSCAAATAPPAGPARRDARPRRARRARRQVRPPDVRRPAAARRARPGAGHRAAGAAARRAALGPRRQGAHPAARRDPPHPARGRHHDPVRHPRPGGGPRGRRPGRA